MQPVIRKQWPKGLLMLAGLLQSGLNLNDALEIFLQESPEPLRSLLRLRSGDGFAWLPFEGQVERLFVGREFGSVRGCLLLSQKSGGPVAPQLVTVARLFQRRMEMKSKVRTLTAQGRMSAWIVAATPFALLLLLKVISPEFVEPLFSTIPGRKLLSMAGLMTAAGLYLVHKAAALE